MALLAHNNFKANPPPLLAPPPNLYYVPLFILGDAYFYNLSVRENLDAIRSVLGVCPQHDILWGDLTAREHMLLFGILKDIPRDRLDVEIQRLLEDVNLTKVILSLSLSSHPHSLCTNVLATYIFVHVKAYMYCHKMHMFELFM